MATKLNKLSSLSVSRLTVPGYYGDGAGLWLQVSASGTKSWIFRFTLAGRSREMGLGPLHTVDLATARAIARDCRVLLMEGRDPIEVRRERKASHAVSRAKAMTFDECAAAYVKAHSGGWKNAKHAAQWTTTLNSYASPVIGRLPVGEVDTPMVVKVLSDIWLTKTETAKRLRGRIERILDWATVSKFRSGDNPARWRGHLDHLLANPSKIAPVQNHAAMPWSQVHAFMTSLRTRDGVAARAVEFAILTAARSGEVRGATWSEIDMDARVWTVPATRMKAGKEHRVPLSDSAMDVLRRLPRMDSLVFPGRKEATPLSDMSLTAVLRRMGHGDVTVHGFRSSFRDWCAEVVGNDFSREVCEHALAHSLPDKVEAAYRRSDLFDRRVELMQAWSEYCHS